MGQFLRSAVAAAALAALAGGVAAAPVTLGGLPMIKQWTDNENVTDEMPDFVWGTADSDGVDSIGLYYEFQDGTTGGLVLDGVAPYWNTSGGIFPGVSVSMATGFFAPYATAGVHFLYNSAATPIFPQALPIAWLNNPVTPYGNNVEPDYNDNGSGSQLRISTTGWGAVTVTTYGGVAAAQVPLPASGLLLAGAISAVAVARRKKRA